MNLRKQLQVGILIAGATCAMSLYAEVITYSAIINNDGANYKAGAAGSFTLPQFDPALGTLLSVTIEIQGHSIGGVNRVHNTSTERDGYVDLSLGSRIQVGGPDTLQVVAFPRQDIFYQYLAKNTDGGEVTWSGDAYAGIVEPNLTRTESASPSDFTEYTGAGTVNYSFSSSAITGLTTYSPLEGNDLEKDQVNPDFNFVATVTYEYDGIVPIPEPGYLTVLLAGFVGHAFLRRRRVGKR